MFHTLAVSESRIHKKEEKLIKELCCILITDVFVLFKNFTDFFNQKPHPFYLIVVTESFMIKYKNGTCTKYILSYKKREIISYI